MKTVLAPLVVILLIHAAGNRCLAQNYLTGELSGNYPAGEYSISGNVHVLPNATLSFAPGSVLRFENYTGIVVRGMLICAGTPLRPIVFTSSRDIADSSGKPEPFDWNGIKVTSEAESIILEHCTVAYSTFGLAIESNTTPVSIKETAFHDNGSSSLTRVKKILLVADNMPISFEWPEFGTDVFAPEPAPAVPASTGPDADTSRHTELTDHPVSSRGWKKGVRIVTGSVAATGGLLVIAGSILSNFYHQKYDEANPQNAELPKLRRNYANKAWITGLGILGLGLTGFTVTFAF